MRDTFTRTRKSTRSCKRSQQSSIFHVSKSESGGIGRRARLRIWYRKVWGFESPLSHHNETTAMSHSLELSPERQ